ncbi:MAG: cation-transporting P-type ATPase [Candidatus Margulisiibacteriota bacterium]
MELFFQAWHAMGLDRVLEKLEVDDETGLSEKEAYLRKEKFGPNELTKKRVVSPLVRFLQQFNQPLIYALLAAGFTTLFLKEFIDSSVIFGVVLVNSIVGYIQETKAVDALSALAKSMKTYSTAVRDGSSKKTASRELVPGDIVMLASGDKVSADMRLLYSKGLKSNESALTGESLPVEKSAESLPESTALADRKNMLYASTLITNGAAKAVVVSTGDRTEIGKISQLVENAEDMQTPLTKKLADFSKLLLYVIMFFSAVTFAIGTFIYGHPAVDSFMAAVAIAVGAIPEGLPAAITIILSIGVARMAKRKAIIRKLPAVETLGSTTIICSDKTGTLTENKMTVQKLFASGRAYGLSGQGYITAGKLTEQEGGKEADLSRNAALKETLLAGLLCNDSKIVHSDGAFSVEGDPTEAALLVSAEKAGLSRSDMERQLKRIDAIPFESDKQIMATLHSTEAAPVVYIKGSNEAVLKRCSFFLDASGNIERMSDAEAINRATEEFASSGLRVIAFAKKEMKPGTSVIGYEDIEGEAVFLGFQAMMDPPRQEAIDAVSVCHNAGIMVKMITGDHASTARAIAIQLGIKAFPADDPKKELIAVTGAEMEKWTEEDYRKKTMGTSVFARVTPEQKLKIVKALQDQKHIVAMTGDGVNDAPALKQANIGVAMGLDGTEVAKEAADVVLTDDNFASIKAAVEEGRGVFDNLRKFIVWTIPTNATEGLVLMVAIIFNFALPISPLQILWINMMTAIFLGMTLAFEPKEDNIMLKKPNDPDLPIFDGMLTLRTIYVSFLLIVGILVLFKHQLILGTGVAAAQTIAANVLVFGEMFYLFNCRSFEKSLFRIGILSNKIVLIGVALMIAVQMFFTYSPTMNRLFGTEPLGLMSWLAIVLFGAGIYIVVETEKKARAVFAARRTAPMARE